VGGWGGGELKFLRNISFHNILLTEGTIFSQDYYQTLGVGKNADKSEIKSGEYHLIMWLGFITTVKTPVEPHTLYVFSYPDYDYFHGVQSLEEESSFARLVSLRIILQAPSLT
jgi:hypothetical protein